MNTVKETNRTWRILALIVAACMTLTVFSTQITYAATKVPSVTIKSAKSVKSGTLKVSWKKAKKAAGYQVVYAKDKKFKKGKKVKTVKKKTTSVTFKKLSKGTKYYAKVRAYKLLDGKKVYGKYSKIKSAKTKGKKNSKAAYYKSLNGKYIDRNTGNIITISKASSKKVKVTYYKDDSDYLINGLSCRWIASNKIECYADMGDFWLTLTIKGKDAKHRYLRVVDKLGYAPTTNYYKY